MAQTFVICKGSTLPYLRMEVVNDGRYDFKKIYLALQSADVTFTMTNLDTGVKKIAKAEAFVVEREDSGCEEGYDIEDFDPDEVSAEIDLEQKEAGTMEVPVNISLPEGYRLLEKVTADVIISWITNLDESVE